MVVVGRRAKWASLSCWVSGALLYPGGHREMHLHTASETYSLKAEIRLLLLYDLSFREVFGSPSVAQNLR